MKRTRYVVAASENLPTWLDDLVAYSQKAANDIDFALTVAEAFGRFLPHPGKGETVIRWEMLSQVAAVDLTVGRVFEAHSDALAILEEAGDLNDEGTWGVFAAEAPGQSLVGTHDLKGWRLNGTKPWCSLGGRLDNALVTAQVADGKRQLFAVSLRQESVTADTSGAWVARGMQNLPSGPVHFNDTPARPIGEHGWYLNRPGFSWGGIGVAACWFGGAAALADQLLSKTVEKASKSSEVSEISALHLGAVDTALHAGAASLRDAAAQIDHGLAETASSELLALRVRAGVAAAVEETMRHVGHALGPAPLAFDEEYARRTADLGLYVRQHHGERDLTILGAALMREGEASSQAAHE